VKNVELVALFKEKKSFFFLFNKSYKFYIFYSKFCHKFWASSTSLTSGAHSATWRVKLTQAVVEAVVKAGSRESERVVRPAQVRTQSCLMCVCEHTRCISIYLNTSIHVYVNDSHAPFDMTSPAT